MGHGKKIELFLQEGTADGVVTAELSNWNGLAIKMPRTDLTSTDIDEIKQPGVYFLFCNEESTGESRVYIGEAQNVQQRLSQHIRDNQNGKELYYWNTAVAFVSDKLDKHLTLYLENRLCDIAKLCHNNELLTKATNQTKINRADKDSMEEFIDNIRILLATLGYKTLTEAPKADATTVMLFCKHAGSISKGFLSDGGFTVVTGSKVSDHTVPSFKVRFHGYFELREKLENNGTIKDRVFTKDYEFSSPSAASAVILGRASNGMLDWKNENGQTLRDINNN